jgi:acyl dehydratase
MADGGETGGEMGGEIRPKTRRGNFFEDYRVGQVLTHAVPRTVTSGDRAVYTSIYPTRFALYASDAFARSCGLPASPLEDLAGFHIVFGKTVPDVSLNAIANLGYAEGRFLRPVYPGDTITATSEVIGLKENSNRKSGVVWVRTTGRRDDGEGVLSYVRWVMVRKRDPEGETAAPVVPSLATAVQAGDLVVPDGLDFSRYDFALAGEPHRWGDYRVGERISARRAGERRGSRAHGDHPPVAEHLAGAFRPHGAARRPAARLWRTRHQPRAGDVLLRARQRAGGRGAERGRACQSLLCWRHGRGLVGGARHGGDRSPRHRRAQAAPRRGQGRGGSRLRAAR